jgi:microcompartment protein CcmK/EutM
MVEFLRSMLAKLLVVGWVDDGGQGRKRTCVMIDAVRQGLGAVNGGHSVSTASAENS